MVPIGTFRQPSLFVSSRSLSTGAASGGNAGGSALTIVRNVVPVNALKNRTNPNTVRIADRFTRSFIAPSLQALAT
jgi:hypothetical protein